jgi:hypothetical protein
MKSGFVHSLQQLATRPKVRWVVVAAAVVIVAGLLWCVRRHVEEAERNRAAPT